MPFSQSLAARTRDALTRERDVTERKMFGGLCVLVDGRLLVGVFQGSLLVRLGPVGASEALLQAHVREMNSAGRPMKGWVLVEPEGVESDRDLEAWVGRAIDFVATLPRIRRG